MSKLTQEYERDFYGWIQYHVELLRQGKLAEIDIEHLIEELESMSKSEKRELISRLVVLLAHLLKWQYQYQQLADRWQQTWQGGSWRGSIIEQRWQIMRQLQDSPSLKSYLPEALNQAYSPAVKIAVAETRLPLTTFPQICSYTLEQILDENYYPDN
jgi:hypothetical protein